MPTLAQEQFTVLIKTRLLHRRKSITDFARELGYARNTVSQAINHPAYYPRVRAKIAKALGVRL